MQLAVRRTHAFDDFADSLKSKMAQCNGNRPKATLFPAFLRDPSEDPLGRSGIEEGEGHGPRKEFFEHAATQISSQGAPRLV